MTGAYWAVVVHLAACVKAARTRAWIDTLLVDAGFVSRALRAHDTLWPASRRTTDVARQAGTYALLVYYAALAVGAARRRRARI